MTAVAGGTYAGSYEATVEGAIIKGSVYGGGNEADVSGNTQVNICAKKYDATEYRRVAPGTAGVTIDHDVFGAGKGVASDVRTALVSGNTTIVMMGGDVKQSVYGGGELSQVGGNTEITVSGGTIGTPMDGVISMVVVRVIRRMSAPALSRVTPRSRSKILWLQQTMLNIMVFPQVL